MLKIIENSVYREHMGNTIEYIVSRLVREFWGKLTFLGQSRIIL